MADPVPAAYADCIDHPEPCPTCGALPGDWCTNPINHRQSAIPCVARSVRAAKALGA